MEVEKYAGISARSMLKNPQPVVKAIGRGTKLLFECARKLVLQSM